MTWQVEFADHFQDWDAGDDTAEDPRIRLAVLDYLGAWISTGPPTDAEIDQYRDCLVCAVPGAPIEISFLTLRRLDPPTIVILGIR